MLFTKQYKHPNAEEKCLKCIQELIYRLNQRKEHQVHHLTEQDKEKYKKYGRSIYKANNFNSLHSIIKIILADLDFFPDIFLLNNLILTLSKLSSFPTLWELFRNIQKHELADTFTYNILLSVISKRKNPKSEWAIELLIEAVEKDLADDVTFNTMLNVIAKSNEPNVTVALAILFIANNKNLVDDILIGTLLNVIANSKAPNVEIAEIIFAYAKSYVKVNAVTYNTMITVIAKSPKPNVGRAIELLEEAKKTGLADVITFSTTMDAIANSKESFDLKLFHNILQQAKEDNKINAFTFNNAIRAIPNCTQLGKEERKQLVIYLIENAKQQDAVDYITYESAIDSLIQISNENYPLAYQYYIEYYERVPSNNIINLHRHNYGTSYVILTEFIKNTKNDSTVTIICGKGLHSNRTSQHSVKEALERVLQEQQKNINSYHQATDNAGVIILHLKGNPNSLSFLPKNVFSNSHAPLFAYQNRNNKRDSLNECANKNNRRYQPYARYKK